MAKYLDDVMGDLVTTQKHVGQYPMEIHSIPQEEQITIHLKVW